MSCSTCLSSLSDCSLASCPRRPLCLFPRPLLPLPRLRPAATPAASPPRFSGPVLTLPRGEKRLSRSGSPRGSQGPWPPAFGLVARPRRSLLLFSLPRSASPERIWSSDPRLVYSPPSSSPPPRSCLAYHKLARFRHPRPLRVPSLEHCDGSKDVEAAAYGRVQLRRSDLD